MCKIVRGFACKLLVNPVVIDRISAAQCTLVEFHVHVHHESFAVFSGSLVTYSIVQYTCVSTGNLHSFP